MGSPLLKHPYIRTYAYTYGSCKVHNYSLKLHHKLTDQFPAKLFCILQSFQAQPAVRHFAMLKWHILMAIGVYICVCAFLCICKCIFVCMHVCVMSCISLEGHTCEAP
jgi:hypothetical protein